MTHLQRQIDELTERVALLEGKLEDKTRGLALARDDADFYEAAWEQENGKLKEHLKNAISLIEQLAKDGPQPHHAFVKQSLKNFKDAILQKVGNREFEDFDTELTIDILGLVVHCEIPYETIACWTREQKMEAEKWAAEQHALASDNDIPMPLMVKPEHVAQLERDNPKRDDLYDVELKPRERTEAPWVTWAKRMKDSPKEWERLHRVERAARATRSAFRTPKRDHTASEMCNVIDAVELERIQEFQGRDWRHGDKMRKKS